MKSPIPNTDDQRYTGPPNGGYNGPGVFNPLEEVSEALVGGIQSGLGPVGGGPSAGTSSAGSGSSGFQPSTEDPAAVAEEAEVGEGQIEPFRVG